MHPAWLQSLSVLHTQRVAGILLEETSFLPLPRETKPLANRKLDFQILLNAWAWFTNVDTFLQATNQLTSDTPQDEDVKLIFTGGHISLTVAFKGPNIILELDKCNYSLTVM